MSIAPVLKHLDFNRPFIIYTDASYTGMGYILAQEHDRQEHPISFESHRTLPSENNYSVTDLEGAAVVWAIEKNRHYLNTQTPVTLITDHKAFTTIFTQELSEDRRRARWILKLNQYKFNIRHRKGRNMAHVDYLSCYPIFQVTFTPFEEIIPAPKWKPTITVVESRNSFEQRDDFWNYEKRKSEAVVVSERDLGREAIPVYEGPPLSTEVRWQPPNLWKTPPLRHA